MRLDDCHRADAYGTRPGTGESTPDRVAGVSIDSRAIRAGENLVIAYTDRVTMGQNMWLVPWRNGSNCGHGRRRRSFGICGPSRHRCIEVGRHLRGAQATGARSKRLLAAGKIVGPSRALSGRPHESIFLAHCGRSCGSEIAEGTT